MSKKIKKAHKLAWWQSEPCPAWCDFRGKHNRTDDPDSGDRLISHPDDRTHYSCSGEDFTLLLMEPDVVGPWPNGLSSYFIPTANVYLVQHFRDAEPHVRIEGAKGKEEFKLTLAEAAELYRRLGRELDRARQAEAKGSAA